MSGAKILVIDDEPNIVKLVSAYLHQEGYEVITVLDGLSGMKAARTFKPDLIVLDIMLPGINGIDLLTQLRRESNVYVIMLTARAEETDKIVGLSLGADDYVTKPFSPRELVARIKSALRRLNSPINEPEIYAFKNVRLNVGSRQVWVGDSEIEMTSLEFDLLKILMENHGRVLSREQLLESVWGFEYFGDTRVVDVHIGHIRQKIGEKYIVTIRSAGYRFEDEAA